ncbi:transcription antiterminator [Lactobacillus selangorensis]|uniref:Transcription antiterminator n=1 Tax=Lactobacillus selangorensis TaxID=81857 RepID=A0A0R2FR38_9LACO|nr:PRD domain-containing protein [Lactobacillus selangorensis]KRN28155.1 transcription antiterminator [Lactobacillus selangorensis]KRN30969.1 transcription antiterminator [Lactobacillus selangorensis]
MRIKRVFNNNVILTEQNGHNAVLIGKGLGFQKKPGDEVNEATVAQTYVPTEQNWITSFQKLMKDIDSAYFEIAAEIISHASETLQMDFNNYLLISLTDHIHFAVYRYQHHIEIQNEVLWETKQAYPREFAVGEAALKRVNQQFQVSLPEDEAGFIAMKFVENSTRNSVSDQMQAKTKMISDILNIIKYQLHLGLSEDNFSYQRFLVHLRFFVNRIFTKTEQHSQTRQDDTILYNHITQKYATAYAAVEKIVAYVTKTTGQSVSLNEQVYLTIHIQRIINEAIN